MKKLVRLSGKITAIKAGKNPRVQRSNIFLDNKFAFSLDNEVIVKDGLRIGRELSAKEVKALTQADHYQRCLNAAFHFLSYRPRSESETRERLEKKGYDSTDVERVLAQLKRLDLVNDTAFAEYWKENRNSFRPRGQRMVKMELRRKGVDSEVINEVVEKIDDTENAYRAAMVKARTLSLADYQIFRQKLGGYLQRRGFSYGVINNMVKRIWQERTQSSDSAPDVTDQVEVLD